MLNGVILMEQTRYQKYKHSYKKWKDNNRDKIRAKGRAYYHRHKIRLNEIKKAKRLENLEIFNENNRVRILKKKEEIAGRLKPEACEICGSNHWKISFDHDHKTGKFRGWICHNCNCALGYSGDNITTLKKLISYLRKHNDKR